MNRQNETEAAPPVICADLVPLPDANENVLIFCENILEQEIELTPSIVNAGDLVEVNLTSTQFDTELMNCTIGALVGGAIFQWNLIDVSGIVDLAVKETFGAFGIESCEDTVCPQTTQFSIDVTNLGTDGGDISVTSLDASVNGGDAVDLIDSLPNTVIGPNDSETVDLEVVLDVCTASSVVVEVLVGLQNSNCDGVTYNFTIFVA